MIFKMSLLQKQLRNVLRGHATSQIRFQQTQAKQRQVQKDKPRVEPILPAKTPVFRNVKRFPQSFAFRDDVGHYTYANIFLSAKQLSEEITRKVGGKTNERVMFLCPHDSSYVITLWAIWMSGQIAVPLSPLHPHNILLYYANDTNAKLLITTNEYVDILHRVGKNTHASMYVLDDKIKLDCTAKEATSDADLEAGLPEKFYDESNGLILYTSGTTGNPKGVILSHKNIHHQVNTLLDAWKWSPEDVILHTLPLSHVHGIINALLCPLSVGAKTVMLPKFNANTVWTRLLAINAKQTDRRITVYMAVPTIYSKLIEEHQRVFGNDTKMVEHVRNTLKNKVRLMVSGSAPLPSPVFDKWLEISGHRLLERYGMTEIGMALSNSYDDPEREPGFVGMPLPGVSIRIAEQENNSYKPLLECTNQGGNILFKSGQPSTDVTGELLVKGDGVFKEYYNRPEATKKEFTDDGWFKTGDICQYSAVKNKIKMLGRISGDIIKSGGYKLSALEIETNLLGHENITDCCVVGLPDAEWGEKVAAVIVVKKDKSITVEELKEWAVDKLPKYAVPSIVKLVESIPKNAMGKINKKELVKLVFSG